MPEDDEILPIWTKEGKHTGEYATRKEVHEKGLIHPVVISLGVYAPNPMFPYADKYADLLDKRERGEGRERTSLQAPWLIATRSKQKPFYGGKKLCLIGEHMVKGDNSELEAIVAGWNEELEVTKVVELQDRAHNPTLFVNLGLTGLVDFTKFANKKDYKDHQFIAGTYLYLCPMPFSLLDRDPNEIEDVRGGTVGEVWNNDVFRLAFTKLQTGDGKTWREVLIPLFEKYDPTVSASLEFKQGPETD